MFGLQRIFITAVIALWLPLCCCQMMAFANASCGIGTEDSCCSNDRQHTDNHADEHPTSNESQPQQSCFHCITKSLPPTPPSLDSFFILSALPFEQVLPPSLIDPSTLHATEVAGCWDVPPPTKPPELAMSTNDRRSTYSIWII